MQIGGGVRLWQRAIQPVCYGTVIVILFCYYDKVSSGKRTVVVDEARNVHSTSRGQRIQGMLMSYVLLPKALGMIILCTTTKVLPTCPSCFYGVVPRKEVAAI